MRIFCDAAVQPLPVGYAAVSAVIEQPDKCAYLIKAKYVTGLYNSTRAEMIAILYSLELANTLEVKEYEVFSASQPAIRIMNGTDTIRNKQKNRNLRKFIEKARAEWQKQDWPSLIWVNDNDRNIFNQAACRVAQLCLKKLFDISIVVTDRGITANCGFPMYQPSTVLADLFATRKSAPLKPYIDCASSPTQ